MITTAIEQTLAEYDTSAIHPCGIKETLYECFTVERDTFIFWYNVLIDDGMTTKIVTHKNQ
jgi:hypothetical protein